MLLSKDIPGTVAYLAATPMVFEDFARSWAEFIQFNHEYLTRPGQYIHADRSRNPDEADARRATSLLYHVASAVALTWEGGRIHEMRGDARRLLLSRMVIDHRVVASDPFRLTENAVQRAITDDLLGERSVGMAEVGELISAA